MKEVSRTGTTNDRDHPKHSIYKYRYRNSGQSKKETIASDDGGTGSRKVLPEQQDAVSRYIVALPFKANIKNLGDS